MWWVGLPPALSLASLDPSRKPIIALALPFNFTLSGPMLGKKDIAAVERRAAAVRLSMAELCALAGMQQSTWSRARQRGTVREKVVRRLEAVLVQREAQPNG